MSQWHLNLKGPTEIVYNYCVQCLLRTSTYDQNLRPIIVGINYNSTKCYINHKEEKMYRAGRKSYRNHTSVGHPRKLDKLDEGCKVDECNVLMLTRNMVRRMPRWMTLFISA
jgi:hypothetical protein